MVNRSWFYLQITMRQSDKIKQITHTRHSDIDSMPQICEMRNAEQVFES